MNFNLLTLTTTQRVGVNTTSPQKALHVSGAIASSLIHVSTDGATFSGLDLLSSFDENTPISDWDQIDRSTWISTNGKAAFFPIETQN